MWCGEGGGWRLGGASESLVSIWGVERERLSSGMPEESWRILSLEDDILLSDSW